MNPEAANTAWDLPRFTTTDKAEEHPIRRPGAVAVGADSAHNIEWVEVPDEIVELAQVIAGPAGSNRWTSEGEELLARCMTGTPPYSQDRFALCDMGEQRMADIDAALRVFGSGSSQGVSL